MKQVFRSILLLGGILLTSCASDKLIQATTAFGIETTKAISVQQKEINIYKDDKEEEFKNLVALRQTSIVINNACVESLTVENPQQIVKLCKIISNENISDYIPPFVKEDIIILANSLKNYAQSLVLLSSDFKADEENLLVALTGITNSVKSLDFALVETGERDSTALDHERIDIIISLISSIANASFQAQRDQTLIELIEKSDSLVQEATSILDRSMEDTKLLRSSTSFQALQDAVLAYEEARKTLIGDELRKFIDIMYVKLEDYKRALAIRNPYPAIGKTHKALIAASRAKFKAEENTHFIEHLLTLVESSALFKDSI